MEDLAYWTTIFTDAGLPHGISQKYAHLFVENRMTTKLLPFLDKDLLKEIGITAVGDIIAILQHCKKVKHEEPTKLKAAVTVSSTTPNLEKDVKKPKLLPGHELPVPEKRTVSREIEGAYKVKLPQGTTEKTRRILQQVKLGPSDSVAKATSPSRIVIINAVSSSKPGSVAQPHTDIDGSDDDAEDVEVILSSSNPCMRTTNFPKPSPKSSVFNRLGAELSQPSPVPQRLKPVTSHLTRFLPSNLGSKTSEAADTSQQHSSPRRTGLKRTASESVFSRLGSGMEQQRTQDAITSGSDEKALSYIGVFKRSRTSAPSLQLPRVPSVDISQRPSAKSRLGTLASDAIGPRRVQDRLGSHNRPT
uniref:Uncharacterized protein C19orf47 homolog n=1 Tax=Schistocephalus solidus TaxID=70667 RepID=A0A0X3P2Y9_SCHSO